MVLGAHRCPHTQQLQVLKQKFASLECSHNSRYDTKNPEQVLGNFYNTPHPVSEKSP